MINDMAESIEPKSDQLNAEDFSIGGPRTFTIESVDVRPGAQDQPVSVWLVGEARPFKPAKTVRKIMGYAWGLDSSKYAGERLTLYCDDDVMWAGKKVGGIRVSHMSGIANRISVPLSKSRGVRVLYVVDPLPDEAPVAPSLPVTRTAAPSLDDLIAAFNTAQIDKSAWLDYCRNVINRAIRSANDLTTDEITTVIEALTWTDPMEPSDAEREAARAREAGE